MAVDTEEKRRSVQGYGSWGVLPVADADIDANDREHLVGLYSGITATAVTVPDFGYFQLIE